MSIETKRKSAQASEVEREKAEILKQAWDYISATRSALLREEPFFAYLSFKMKFAPSWSVPTMAVNDRGEILFNPKYVVDLIEKSRKGNLEFHARFPVRRDGGNFYVKSFLASAIVHEILHFTLGHVSKYRNEIFEKIVARTRKSDKKLMTLKELVFNVGCDAVVNWVLHENGYPINKSWVWIDWAKGKTSEEVIQELSKRVKITECKIPEGYPVIEAPWVYSDEWKVAKSSRRPSTGYGREAPMKAEPGEGEVEGGKAGKKDVAGKGKGGPSEDVKSFLEKLKKEAGGLPFDKIEASEKGGEFEIDEKERDRLAKEWSREAYYFARQAGKLPGGLEQFFSTILAPPKIPWHQKLRSAFTTYINIGRRKETWLIPDRRYIAHGIKMPGTLDTIPKVVVAIDVSGSVSDDELREFISETAHIIRAARTPVHLILCDADIQKHWKKMNLGKLLKGVDVKGRGGTSYRPVFTLIKKKRIKPHVIIYFTDGYCEDFPPNPRISTIWVLPKEGSSDFKPPFGEVLRMD